MSLLQLTASFWRTIGASELKALKVDAWTRIYRLFKLPESNDQVYRLIDPYRRGYFIARDLSAMDLDEMEEAVLADIELLEEQAAEAKTAGKASKNAKVMLPIKLMATKAKQVSHSKRGYFVEYLKVNLEVWDSGNSSPGPIHVTKTSHASGFRRKPAASMLLNASMNNAAIAVLP